MLLLVVLLLVVLLLVVLLLVVLLLVVLLLVVLLLVVLLLVVLLLVMLLLVVVVVAISLLLHTTTLGPTGSPGGGVAACNGVVGVPPFSDTLVDCCRWLVRNDSAANCCSKAVE